MGHAAAAMAAPRGGVVPPAEGDFLSESDAAGRQQVRFWIRTTLGMSFVFLALDLSVLPGPGVREAALLGRLGLVVPLCAIALWWMRRPRRRRLEATAAAALYTLSMTTTLVLLAGCTPFNPARSLNVFAFGTIIGHFFMPNGFRLPIAYTAVSLLLGEVLTFGPALGDPTLGVPAEDIVGSHTAVVLSMLAKLRAGREARRSFLLGLRLHERAVALTRSNEQLRALSDTDALTGLANRRFFDAALARAWQGRGEVGLMMIDVDHFKLFNDTAGHPEGDRCLATVARAVSGHVRGHRDIPARFGGEEFVVLLPNTGLEEAAEIAERIRTAIAALRVFHPGRVGEGFVSVSIGVAAMRPSAATPPSALVRAADQALYAAKAAGRNRVVPAGGG
ncbi:GGDEF domain-containing protein [Roseomonas nepalensis]|uniref:diguanylate cyclase n=1 Tax=Muricoccus nepalensis TaxID=1854500 RepID=A0A502FKA1_9PROT|nr:GGDEF domain-containing protein [Roseomonas nepalensis]